MPVLDGIHGQTLFSVGADVNARVKMGAAYFAERTRQRDGNIHRGMKFFGFGIGEYGEGKE